MLFDFHSQILVQTYYIAVQLGFEAALMLVINARLFFDNSVISTSLLQLRLPIAVSVY